MKHNKRCTWVPLDKQDYVHYHDTEWGRPVYEDRLLFEMLVLEGAQAGLSWYTILKKREGYKKAFKNFDAQKISKLTDEELETILLTADIVRNRLKVFSVRKNAKVFIELQKEFGSFSKYLWRFVNEKQIKNNPKSTKDIRTTSPEAQELSRDLQKRGMSFVGGSITYAYMQAVGLINDHTKDCFLADTKN